MKNDEREVDKLQIENKMSTQICMKNILQKKIMGKLRRRELHYVKKI